MNMIGHHSIKRLVVILLAVLLAPLSVSAANITVDSTADNLTAADTQCTLREAITNANNDADCSVTGGFVYRGEALPELDGWYVYGDFCSGKIWAANTADESEPVLLAETGLPIASFAELPDGEIVALTFGNEIALLERS